MIRLTEDQRLGAEIVLMILGVLLGFYLVLVLTAGISNASQDELYCKNVAGKWDGEPTRNRYVYNPWSVWTQGECINGNE